VIGLFFFGMGATLIGALIVWYVINKYVVNNEEE